MSKKSKEDCTDFAVLLFYNAIRDLLADAGLYAHSYKLRRNLDDPATEFRVRNVFLKYYNGEYSELDSVTRSRYYMCLDSIEKINQLCVLAKIQPIRDKEVLTDLLLDPKRRDGWKKIIRKYQKRNQIIPPFQIELEYRESLNKKTP